MTYKSQSPGANGARQQFTQVQNAVDTPKPGITQLVRPRFADIEAFTGEQYDEQYEDALTATIEALIMDSSTCVDRPDAIFCRPSEIIAALATVMAKFITMDPSASPASVRKGVDRVADHLRDVALDMLRNPEPRTLMAPRTQGDGWLA